MATYIAQFNEYTHKVQTLKVSSNFKVATALATAGDYKRIYDLLSIMFDYKAIENLKLDKGVILPDGKGVRRTSHKMTTFDCKNLFDAFGALQDLSTRNDILIVIVTILDHLCISTSRTIWMNRCQVYELEIWHRLSVGKIN